MPVIKMNKLLLSTSFCVILLIATSASAMRVTYTYDKLNRVTSATFGEDRIEYQYDSNGNIEEVITPEGCTTVVYRDQDGDNYGTSDISLQTCNQALGYVADSTDCNDNDPNEHPDQSWYPDLDNDGFYFGLIDTTSCTRPSGYKTASELISLGLTDNAPGQYNPDQEDADADNVGDVADKFPNNAIYNQDVDGDGIADEWELATFNSLDVADGTSDFDSDSLTDLQEFTIGSNPKVSINTKWDINGDGIIGIAEAIHALQVTSGTVAD